MLLFSAAIFIVFLFAFCIIIPAFTVSAGPASLNGQWRLPDLSPAGREGHSFGCTESNQFESETQLFVLGGRGADGQEKSLFMFKLSTQRWEKNTQEGYDSDVINAAMSAIQLSDVNYEIVTAGGRSASNNGATGKVQIFASKAWSTISALNPDELTAREAKRYLFGTWNARLGDLDNGASHMVGTYFVGGIDDQGFALSPRLLVYNRSDGVSSARWAQALDIKSIGIQGSDYPVPLYGQCCAKDPHPGSSKAAFCFGGTNKGDDTNEVWRVQYGTGWPKDANSWSKLTTTGTAPSARRQAACGFVAMNRFAVWGGFDSDTARPSADNGVYVLNVLTGAWTKTIDGLLKPASSAKMATCFFSSNSSYRTFLFGGGGGYEGDDIYSATLYSWDAGQSKFVTQVINNAVTGSNLQKLTATKNNVAGVSPAPRSDHSSLVLLEKLLVVGGQDEAGQPLSDVWEYDALLETWKRIAFTSSIQMGSNGGLLTPSSSSSSSSSSSASSTSFAPRYAASMCEVGGNVYIYGGVSTNGELLSDLVAIDTLESSFAVTYGGAGAPGARSHHAAFVARNSLIVINGGKNSLGKSPRTWHVFDLTKQVWSDISCCGVTDPATAHPAYMERYGHISLAYNETHAVYGLGFSQGGTSHELYWVTGIALDSQAFTVTAFNVNNAAARRRDYIRAYAATALVGQYLIVCGGVSTTDKLVSYSHSAICYSVDTHLYTWQTLTGMGDNWILASATLSHIGNKLYLVSGSRCNGVAVVQQKSDQVLQFTFETTNLCATGQTVDCTQCSPGFMNPPPGASGSTKRCTAVAKGKYVDRPWLGSTDCPAGTANNRTGATNAAMCYPCGYGTFQSQRGAATCVSCPEGMICPIGADAAMAMDSPRAVMLTQTPASAKQVQPAAYESPGVPKLPVLVVGCFILILIIIMLLIVCIRSLKKKSLRSYYIKDSAVIQQWYDQCATARYGMSEPDFLRCLVELAADPMSGMPPHTIDVDTAHRIFCTVDCYHNATLHSADELEEAVILAIAFGYMTPFADTPAATSRRMPGAEDDASSLSVMRLEQFDRFDDQHAGLSQVGEPIRIAKTTHGGVFSLIMMLVVVIVIVATIISFLLSATVETKSSIPAAVVYDAFGAAKITADFEASVTYWSILRTGLGANTLREACLFSPNTTAGDVADAKCASAVVTANGFMLTNDSTSVDTSNKGGPASTTPVIAPTCTWDSRAESCVVTWRCLACTFASSVGEPGNLTFLVSPSMAAPIVKAKMQISTGIRAATENFFGAISPAGGSMLYSSVEAFAKPRDRNLILTGYPATAFAYELTPTYFESSNLVALWGVDSTTRDTGYHVRAGGNDPVPGNAVPPAAFGRYFDVPVTISFNIDQTPLLVKRLLITTLIDLANSLLGGVSGVVSLLITCLGVYEGMKWRTNENHEADDAPLEDVDAARQPSSAATKSGAGGDDDDDMEMATKKNNNSHLHHAHCHTQIARADFDKLQVLMQSGLTLQQSAAVMDVIKAGVVGLTSPASSQRSTVAKAPPPPSPTAAGAGNNTNGTNNNCEKQLEQRQDDPPAPEQSRLDAPDYEKNDESPDSPLFSQSAQLHWHQERNLFWDPACSKWWDNNQKMWLN